MVEVYTKTILLAFPASMAAAAGARGKAENAARRKSLAEWVTLSLSVLVVAALVIVALVEESRRQDET